MPNRVIKDSIRTSKTINSLSDFQFRLWIHLILSADDFGRGFADPELVKNLAFPRRKRVTESDIGKALSELAGMGCISLYESDGESYFCFPRWSDHQRIQSKVSKFPGPASSTEDHRESPLVTVSHRESPLVTVSHRESPLESRSEKREARSENTESKKAKSAFIPPTLQDVEKYCEERGNDVDPKRFFDYYAVAEWKDKDGNPVKNWKQKMISVWENDKKSPKAPTTAGEKEPVRSQSAVIDEDIRQMTMRAFGYDES